MKKTAQRRCWNIWKAILTDEIGRNIYGAAADLRLPRFHAVSFFAVTNLIVLMMTNKETRLNTAIMASPEMTPEAMTTLPSRTNRIAESFRKRKKC